MREKLIELLNEGFQLDGADEAVVADHLIANGVTVRKKGEWKFGGYFHYCSECGHMVGLISALNYCPNCGADMTKGGADV